jgi:hypothetical protein
MARPAKLKIDPLLAALIEKLPASGTDWPAAKRAAWLDNMARAFDTVYEGAAMIDRRQTAAQDVSQIVDLNKAYVEIPRTAPASPALRAVSVLSPDGSKMHAGTVEVSPPRPQHECYIDHDGMARRHDGVRIMPGDVIGALFDMRGETGDPGAIVWADGSRGVRGLQLNIAA